jgi:hypothetical protein
MTTKEIMARFQSYYGLEYGNGAFAVDCEDWLDRLSDNTRQYLYGETIRVHQRKWRTLPDIAVWEEVVASARQKARSAILNVPARAMIADNEPNLSRDEVAKVLAIAVRILTTGGEE